jgi:aminotransferase
MMASQTKHHISQRVLSIAPSATKQVAVLANQVGGCVSLGQGVPSFPTPPHVVEAAVRALRDNPDSGKYTLQPGLIPLREAIAAEIEQRLKIKVDPLAEVGVTVGAMEGLLAAFMTVVDAGDEVIVPSPGYASHIEQILLAEGKPVFAPLDENNWGLNIDRIRDAITKRTRAILLCNPGNPTGAVFDDQSVQAVCSLALEHDLYILADETYEYLVYDGPSPLSPARIEDLKDRVITVASFSKKYAFTGWRIGWVHATAELMDQMMKVHDAAVIAAPTVSQYAALAALTGPQEPYEEMRLELAARRDLCLSRLDRLPDHFAYNRPGGAFYIMAKYLFSRESSDQLAQTFIRQPKVVTVPGGSYGPGGEGHLRLSYGGTPEIINQAFDRIEQWLAEK